MPSYDKRTFTTIWLPKALVEELRSRSYEGEAVHRTLKRIISQNKHSKKSAAELLKILLEKLEEGEL